MGSLPFVAILTLALHMAGVLVPTRQKIEEEGRSLRVLRLFMLFGLPFVLVNATVFWYRNTEVEPHPLCCGDNMVNTTRISQSIGLLAVCTPFKPKY